MDSTAEVIQRGRVTQGCHEALVSMLRHNPNSEEQQPSSGWEGHLTWKGSIPSMLHSQLNIERLNSDNSHLNNILVQI